MKIGINKLEKMLGNKLPSKMEQMVIAGIRVMSVVFEEHVEGWEYEFNHNDGYLKANYKINMYAVRKTLRELVDQYKHITIKQSHGERFINECRTFQSIQNKRKQITVERIVDMNNQRYLPRENFILNFYIMEIALTWLKERYEPSVKKLGLEKQLDKVIDNYNKYAVMFEKEIIFLGDD